MTYQHRILSGLAVGVLGLGLLSQCLQADAEPRSGPAPKLGLAAPGRVEPLGEERELGPQVPGLLARVLVEENAEVSAGQVLAEIDRSDLEAQRRAAAAGVELKRAQRTRLRNGARTEERRAAQARWTAAQAAMALAEKEHQRNQELWQAAALTEADRDRSAEAVDSARARAQEAQQQLLLLEAPARADELAIADAELALAEAQLAGVEAAIEKTFVRAPIAGTVLKRYRRQGEMVGTQPLTPIFVIGDLRHRAVRAEIDELDVARIAVGDRVEVSADAFPARRFPGRVSWVAERVGAKSVHTERPAERQDRKVLEALIELEAGAPLPVGLRVDVYGVE